MCLLYRVSVTEKILSQSHCTCSCNQECNYPIVKVSYKSEESSSLFTSL